MDDATSHVYSAFLVDEEGTMSTFTALCEVIAAKGLFTLSKPTAAATTSIRRRRAARSTRASRPRFGRALSRFGSSTSRPCSPEARGRMERLFQTFRLPQELRAAGPQRLIEDR